MCCIDIYTKFAHVRKVKTLSSKQAKLTFQEFQKLSLHRVHTVQTDNGSEFFDNFHAYLKEQEIKHQFIYPKSPKINGVVERFNRTIQEEFINNNF
jgi:IS30 family transposase